MLRLFQLACDTIKNTMWTLVLSRVPFKDLDKASEVPTLPHRDFTSISTLHPHNDSVTNPEGKTRRVRYTSKITVKIEGARKTFKKAEKESNN